MRNVEDKAEEFARAVELWARTGAIQRARVRPWSRADRIGHAAILAFGAFWLGYMLGVVRFFGPFVGVR